MTSGVPGDRTKKTIEPLGDPEWSLRQSRYGKMDAKFHERIGNRSFGGRITYVPPSPMEETDERPTSDSSDGIGSSADAADCAQPTELGLLDQP